MQTQEEIWKDVPGYEDNYQVSNLGNVKSKERIKMCRGKFPFVKKETKLTPVLNDSGYGIVGLFLNGKQRKFSVHQLVAMCFLGHERCGMELVINHKNFVRNYNLVNNLEIVSSRKNSDRKHLPSTSKYTGVSWNKKMNKWSSKIMYKKQTIGLGYFESEKEASKYYENALKAIENGTEIVKKIRKKTSKYKHICFDNGKKKWRAYVVVDKKYKTIGYFNTEEDAYIARKNKLQQIKKPLN